MYDVFGVKNTALYAFSQITEIGPRSMTACNASGGTPAIKWTPTSDKEATDALMTIVRPRPTANEHLRGK